MHRRPVRTSVIAAVLLAACASDPPAPDLPASLQETQAQASGAEPRSPVPAGGCDAAGKPPLPDSFASPGIAEALLWVQGDQRTDLYCGCAFDARLRVAPEACGYRNERDLAPVVQWEHVVPPLRFGAYRRCWQPTEPQSGNNVQALENCARTDAEFRAMERDLYNIYPALGWLAGQRRDHNFGDVSGERRAWGKCDFETERFGGKSAVVEPPDAVKGDIARIHFYMAWRYGRDKDWKIRLSNDRRRQLEQWHRADPVDDRERARACRVEAIQGWANPFVKGDIERD